MNSPSNPDRVRRTTMRPHWTMAPSIALAVVAVVAVMKAMELQENNQLLTDRLASGDVHAAELQENNQLLSDRLASADVQAAERSRIADATFVRALALSGDRRYAELREDVSLLRGILGRRDDDVCRELLSSKLVALAAGKRPEEANPLSRESLALSQRLLLKNLHDETLRNRVVITSANLGRNLTLAGHYEEALPILAVAIEECERIMANYPIGVPNYVYLLADGYACRGQALWSLSRDEEALESLSRAAEMLRELCEQYPRRELYYSTYGTTLINRAVLLLRLERPADAAEVFASVPRLAAEDVEERLSLLRSCHADASDEHDEAELQRVVVAIERILEIALERGDDAGSSDQVALRKLIEN